MGPVLVDGVPPEFNVQLPDEPVLVQLPIPLSKFSLYGKLVLQYIQVPLSYIAVGS